MKKTRILAVIMSLCLLICMTAGTAVTVTAATDTWDGTVATSFDGGSGTENDPYQIATGAQLAYLASLINGSDNSAYCSCYYVLTADIDLNKINWTPIGYKSAYCFKGTFDGNGHTISNLYMSSTSLYGGLFGMVSAATIKNVTLSNCDITGYTFSGGIVGYVQAISSTVIQNCTVSGSVTCVQNSTSACLVGGIVGNGNYTSLINCVNNATVTASNTGRGSIDAGGLAGDITNGSISSSYNTGRVTVTDNNVDNSTVYIGGLVGRITSMTVSDSYNTGSITANLSAVTNVYAGGLFGYFNTGCTTGCCYNTGDVTATAKTNAEVGGIAGSNSATISNTYNTGTVSGTSTGSSADVGGIVGYNFKTVEYSHNVGSVSASGKTFSYAGGIIGYNTSSASYSYYLSTSADAGVGNTGIWKTVVSKTAEEFASGEVAYLLNGSVSGGTPWYQTIGTDSYPIFDSTHLLVYTSATCIGTISSYNNTGDNVAHSNLVHYDAVDATCTSDGSIEYWCCSDCGKYFDATVTTEITDTTTLTTSATGHTDGEAVVENEVEATCTTDGSYDTVIYCSVCGEELSRETTTVPATGHSLTHVDAQAPTCTETGNSEYWYCSVCSEYFSDSSASATTSLDDVTIAAKGHSYGEPTIENEVEATCTTDGSYDTVIYCSVCGEEVSRITTTIAATGHTEGEPVTENEVEATCTTDGSYDTVVYCTVCGEEISRETTTVPATGHSYEAVVTDPTCTEGGYTTYTCSVCGDSYVDDYTEALGHSYEAVVTDPTCTEGGYTTYTCSVCGDSYVDDYTEALGHTYGEPVWTWDVYGGATATFTCVNDSSHVEVITATITAVGNLGVVTKTATVEFNGVTYTSDSVTTGTRITIPQSTSPAVTTEETTTTEESVTIDEPVEDTDTDDEPDEMDVSEPVEEPEPEENPTTGIALALLPIAIAIAGVVSGKKK